MKSLIIIKSRIYLKLILYKWIIDDDKNSKRRNKNEKIYSESKRIVTESLENSFNDNDEYGK